MEEGYYTLKDKMARQKIVNDIFYNVSTMPIFDSSTMHDVSESNTSIMVNGQWGSGKSYVMHMLEEKFRADENYIVVNYDAWKNNFYSDPLIAILYCIIDELKDQIYTLEVKCKTKAKKVIKSLLREGKNKLDNHIREFISKLSDSKNIKLALFGYVATKIFDVAKEANKTILDDETFNEFKSYKILLEEAKSLLNNLTTTIKDSNLRLVILVDELDRCLPNEQMLVLERLHHLFDIKNCAVIVALNRRAVAACYEKNYSDEKGVGVQYLRKFFRNSFHLSPKELTYLENSLSEILTDDQLGIVLSEDQIKVILCGINTILARYQNDKIIVTARDYDDYISYLKLALDACHKEIELDFIKVFFIANMMFRKLFLVFGIDAFVEGHYELGKFVELSEIIGNDRMQYIEKANFTPYVASSKEDNYLCNYQYYQDDNYNILQYIFNYCLLRNDKTGNIKLLESLAKLPVIEGRKYNTQWVDSIIKIIDRYGNSGRY